MELENSLVQLNQIFPATDSAIRTMFRPDENHADLPSHGFFGIMRALSDEDSNSNIKHLEIRRDENMFTKRGVFLDRFDRDDGFMVSAFRNLTNLTLCLEPPHRSQTEGPPKTPLLANALANAPKLQRLEIYAAFQNYWAFQLKTILPFQTFPDLRTLVLEEMHFNTQDVCRWLFIQPKLRNLVLRRPYLHGHWKDAVKRWSQRPEFVLESLELKSPWDHDVKAMEQEEEGCKVPSRVPSEAILHYINYGGTNPFDSQRRWRKFDRGSDGVIPPEGQDDHLPDFLNTTDEDSEHQDQQCDLAENLEHAGGNGDQDGQDGRLLGYGNNVGASWDQEDQRDRFSEFSDMSEWLPEDHPTPIYPSDGPEYDEDYDFDAEDDSDTDMD